MAMTQINLSIHELELDDMDSLMAYWLNADEFYLRNMGVDIRKLPTENEFATYWKSQLELPVEKRLSYCVVWQKNNISIGHSSTRPTNFGKDAYMHLHLWNAEERQKGLGYEFVKLT